MAKVTVTVPRAFSLRTQGNALLNIKPGVQELDEEIARHRYAVLNGVKEYHPGKEQAVELRTDGPTLAEHVAAGGDPADYPPKGFDVKLEPKALPTASQDVGNAAPAGDAAAAGDAQRHGDAASAPQAAADAGKGKRKAPQKKK